MDTLIATEPKAGPYPIEEQARDLVSLPLDVVLSILEQPISDTAKVQSVREFCQNFIKEN